MRLLIIIFLFFLRLITSVAATPMTTSKQDVKNRSSSLAPAFDSSKDRGGQQSLTPNLTATSHDLANQASSEKLPQVSAAILRTQLQQETDSTKRHEIALRLAEILLKEERPSEALFILESKDIVSTQTEKIDELVLFWKAQVLLTLKRPNEATPLLEQFLEKLCLLKFLFLYWGFSLTLNNTF